MATENTLNITNTGVREWRWAESFNESMQAFRVPVGNSYAPTYTFNGYVRTGMYLSETDDAGGSNPEIRFVVYEAEMIRINDDYVRFPKTVLFKTGTAAAPSWTFKDDQDTGMFLSDTAKIGITIAGTEKFQFDANSIKGPDGSVGTPAFSFTSDTDTGLYLPGAGNIGVAIAGTKVVDLDATTLNVDGVNLKVNTTTSGAVNIMSLQNKATPAVNNGTSYNLTAYDAGSTLRTYGSVTGRVKNTTVGADHGEMYLATRYNGATRTFISFDASVDRLTLNAATQELLRATSSLVNWNAFGADIDHQFEGTGNQYVLYLDAGNDRVGIKNASPLAVLDVIGDARFGDSTTNYVEVESDGDVNFVGGAGLQCGGISVYGNSTSDSVAAATLVQLTRFDTNDPSNGSVTPDHTNDHITIGKAGYYFVTFSVSFSGDGSVTWDGGVYINNGATQITNLQTRRKLGAGGDVGAVSISGIADFAANDTVEIWFQHDAGVNKNITVVDACLSVVQVAGT